jgi:hypothetical protein
MLAIYLDVFPRSERKSRTRLAEMLSDSSYYFFVGEEAQDVVAFAICKQLHDVDSALLEYMAVKRDLWGQKLGAEIFHHVVDSSQVSMGRLLLEVEDDTKGDPRSDEARRKSFYRGLGCREVSGLDYIMPTVVSSKPPPMSLMVHTTPPRNHVSKIMLESWLRAIYVQVYGRAENDDDILRMLEDCPERAALI